MPKPFEAPKAPTPSPEEQALTEHLAARGRENVESFKAAENARKATFTGLGEEGRERAIQDDYGMVGMPTTREMAVGKSAAKVYNPAEEIASRIMGANVDWMDQSRESASTPGRNLGAQFSATHVPEARPKYPEDEVKQTGFKGSTSELATQTTSPLETVPQAKDLAANAARADAARERFKKNQPLY
jgi:hypothetical protein